MGVHPGLPGRVSRQGGIASSIEGGGPFTIMHPMKWLPACLVSLLLCNLSPAATPAVRLTIAPGAGGGWEIRWAGESGFSSQLEQSINLQSWGRLDLPAPEVAGGMAVAIPPYLLRGSARYFRLRRDPLVDSAIPPAPGMYRDRTFVHGGIARHYHLQIPDGWAASRRWPLMLVLPGHNQSIAEFASLQAELLARANISGVILVLAEATAGIDSYKWFALENPRLSQPYVDDAAFLVGLTKTLAGSALNVDAQQIYLAGFSNGGSMAHYLASRTNHPFAAFAMIESGIAPLAPYREPYDRLAPDTGSNVVAVVPPPHQPRPVLLMNMATSFPWVFEGRGPLRGVRETVSRWTQVNGYGAPVTNVARGILEPPPATLHSVTNWTAVGNARARVSYEDIRPDADWPEALLADGWNPRHATNFTFVTVSGDIAFDQRLPAWVRQDYPHVLQADPALPEAFTRVNSGTMTVEFWRRSPADRSQEVIFVGLSDGGHQWPNLADKLPFNASIEVLRFFGAH